MKRILHLFLVLNTLFLVAQEGDFKLHNYMCLDQIRRPYVLHTPKDTKTKKPLIVFLHGSISTPNLKTNPLDYAQNNSFNAILDNQQYYVLYPFGQKDATWFDKIGTEMVFGEIKEVIAQNNIDTNKIFLAGFSDGASGTFYFSMTYPELFAGFIPLNGMCSVADKLGEHPIFPENSNQKPMFVVNTKSDMLYPSRIAQPLVEHLQKYNTNIVYQQPQGGHDMGYLDVLKTDIQSFINSNQKQPLQSFVWESTQKGTINIATYITIKQIDTTDTPKKWHTNNHYAMYNDKADLGVIFNNKYRGKGLEIESFKYKNTTAERIGLKSGDILIAFEQDTIRSKYSHMAYTQKKKAEDPLAITFIRDGEYKTVTGNFNKGTTSLLFNNQKSYKIKARIEGNALYIDTSRVVDFEVFYHHPELQNIKYIYINGQPLNLKKTSKRTK